MLLIFTVLQAQRTPKLWIFTTTPRIGGPLGLSGARWGLELEAKRVSFCSLKVHPPRTPVTVRCVQFHFIKIHQT